ncbi:uncharacterized protein LOC141745083 isoform X2 [Larus michahellis]|uniref:uncharacterized protein LOC141745083 isoform X2 n=1 Tax=Larus michahellis TaxID=119627 RepID=UPI003D9BFAE7
MSAQMTPFKIPLLILYCKRGSNNARQPLYLPVNSTAFISPFHRNRASLFHPVLQLRTQGRQVRDVLCHACRLEHVPCGAGTAAVHSCSIWRSVCHYERKLDEESSSQDCLCAGPWSACPSLPMAHDVLSATSFISSWITEAFQLMKFVPALTSLPRATKSHLSQLPGPGSAAAHRRHSYPGDWKNAGTNCSTALGEAQAQPGLSFKRTTAPMIPKENWT